MIGIQARVRTPAASKYLQQLCKHFRHKIQVEFTPTNGRADFPFGVCTMVAADGELHLVCNAADDGALAKVRHIVHDHLERFAWREKPEIDWQPI